MMKHIFLLGLAFIANAYSETLEINKGAVVHLFEWRWKDIAKECEFLNLIGYAGVLISPPNENAVVTNRPWEERYEPVSFDFITRSGTEAELREMIRRCNNVGIWVFADVILNHMTKAGRSKGTGDSTCDYNTYNYPVFKKEHFHQTERQITNYKDRAEVRTCELDGKRDLDQSNKFVRSEIIKYLNTLIDMGVAGFRIDAAKHMEPEDLKEILSKVNDLNQLFGFPTKTRPFVFLDVVDYGEGSDAVTWDEYKHLGHVTDYRYGYQLAKTFTGQTELQWLQRFSQQGKLIDDKSMVFVDNFLTQRNRFKHNELNYELFRPYKMAIAFMLAYDWGTPIIMSGYRFNKDVMRGPPMDEKENIKSPFPIKDDICSNDWSCEHRWRQIYSMVRFRNVVAGTQAHKWQGSGKKLAFCRGDKGFVAFNTDNRGGVYEEFETCLPEGTYCDVISGYLLEGKCTGKTVVIDKNGKAKIEISQFILSDGNINVDGVLALHVMCKVGEEDDACRIDKGRQKTAVRICCDEHKKRISFCNRYKGFFGVSKNKYNVNDLVETCLPQGRYCDMVSGTKVNTHCTGRMMDIRKDGTGIIKASSSQIVNQNTYKTIALHVSAKLSDKFIEEDKDRTNKIPGGSAECGQGYCTTMSLRQKIALKLPGLPNLPAFLKMGSSNIPNIDFGSDSSFCERADEFKTLKSALAFSQDAINKGNDDNEVLKKIVRDSKLEVIGDLSSLITLAEWPTHLCWRFPMVFR